MGCGEVRLVPWAPSQQLIALRPSNYVCACCQNGNWGTKTKVKVVACKYGLRSLHSRPWPFYFLRDLAFFGDSEDSGFGDTDEGRQERRNRPPPRPLFFEQKIATELGSRFPFFCGFNKNRPLARTHGARPWRSPLGSVNSNWVNPLCIYRLLNPEKYPPSPPSAESQSRENTTHLLTFDFCLSTSTHFWTTRTDEVAWPQGRSISGLGLVSLQPSGGWTEARCDFNQKVAIVIFVFRKRIAFTLRFREL